MPQNVRSKLVVVTDDLADHVAGAVVFWELSGVIYTDRLRASWEAAGLDEALLPELPTPAQALRRAVMEQRERRQLVRPLGNGNGFAIVDERVNGDDLDWRIKARVRVDVAGRFVIEPRDHPCGDELCATYHHCLNALSTEQTSGWLVGLAEHVGAVGLRGRGGFYFIAANRLPAWHAMMCAIEAASGKRLYEMPAMRSDQAVRAVLDAVTREAQKEAAKLRAELDAGDMGERALQTRTNQLADLRRKVEGYEGLLGDKLNALREELTALSASLGAATLVTLAGQAEM